MLLFLPSASCKFLAQWQVIKTCHHTVIKRVGPVNCHLEQLGKYALTQLYHINMPKCWTESVQALTASSIPLPRSVKQVHMEEGLTPTHQQGLQELENQIRDLFTTTPRLTRLIQHDIKTPPGTVFEAYHQATEKEVAWKGEKHQGIHQPLVKLPHCGTQAQ